MSQFIRISRSIIPACDFDDIKELHKFLLVTKDVDGIQAYKIGFSLGLTYSLSAVTNMIHSVTGKKVIYDHQKAGTDVPHTGKKFAKVCKAGGIDSVILFPQSGPITQKQWIEDCLEEGLHVITGGMMTHEGYLSNENGYLMENAPQRMYELSYMNGIKDFVVPGNRPEYIKSVRESFGSVTLYAPGFIAQDGSITEAGKAAQDNWHAIVGRALMNAKDPKDAAETLCKDIFKSEVNYGNNS